MVDSALFSSASDEWSTPKWLFDRLNRVFNFAIDAACTKDNACVGSAGRAFTQENDGLKQAWDANTFCNPPYSKIKDWVSKAALESRANPYISIVLLIPARVDTAWWHEWVVPFAESVTFLRGRLKFGDSKNSAPFPSAVVHFNFVERFVRSGEVATDTMISTSYEDWRAK